MASDNGAAILGVTGVQIQGFQLLNLHETGNGRCAEQCCWLLQIDV